MDGFDCEWITDTFTEGQQWLCASAVQSMQLRQDRLYEVLNVNCSAFEKYYVKIFSSYLYLKDKLSYFKLEKLIRIDENICVAKYILINDNKQIFKVRKMFMKFYKLED